MKKTPVLIALMVIFALMGSVAYYFDENDETDKAFAVARWMIIPFIIIVDIAFIGLISRFITWIKNFKK